ncbi:MAG: hypothetical protein AB7D57_14990 [Desulfovibrionaceae bacterium]
MIKNLTRHGNSLALVIDKPILELLKIEPDTPLEIGTDGERLTITPVRDAERAQRFAQGLERINARYGKALKALAD